MGEGIIKAKLLIGVYSNFGNWRKELKALCFLFFWLLPTTYMVLVLSFLLVIAHNLHGNCRIIETLCITHNLHGSSIEELLKLYVLFCRRFAAQLASAKISLAEVCPLSLFNLVILMCNPSLLD